MSPQAVRVRTSSGWQDIAIQGAQGPPGRMLSCRAQSAISFAAADTYYRGLGLNFTTVAFDDFGNSFAGGLWTCRQTGRYLIIASFEGLANTGNVGIAVGPKRTSSTVTKGADGNTWGTELVFIGDYTVGQQLGAAGYHSGGGAGTFTFEAIRIDAPSQALIEVPIWQNWTPVIKQGGAAIGISIVRARYCQVGKVVHYQATLTTTGAGIAGNAVNISGWPIPFVVGNANQPIGNFWMSVAGLSPAANIIGNVYVVDVVSAQMIMGGQPSNFVGATPSFACANGTFVTIGGTYEAV